MHAEAQRRLAAEPTLQTLQRFGIRFVVSSLIPASADWSGPGFTERIRAPAHNLRIIEVAGRNGPFSAPPSVEFHATLQDREPERRSYTTRSPTDVPLSYPEMYYPGWSARVDDDLVTVEPTSDGLMSLKVPSGEHRVSLDYQPSHRYLGAAISAGALLLWTALVCVKWAVSG